MPTSTWIMIGVMVVIAAGYAVFMAVFRKKMGWGAAWGGALGGEQAHQVTADLKRGDFNSLRALLQTGDPTDWDDHTFFCDLLAPRAPDHLLEAWCQQEPDQALPFLVRGRALVERAWEARGRGTADSVTEQGRKQFGSLLEAAEQDLKKAAELDPRDPAPWAFLISVAKGLGQEFEDAQYYFDAATGRDPENFAAHLQMLSFLCEKWHGDHDTMFEFARSAVETLPDGADLGVLPILAHIERWLYFSFEDNEKGAVAYLKDLQAREECLAAYETSLGSPNLRVRSSTVLARNIAALWFFLVEDKRHLQLEVAQIGNAHTDHPWQYWDTPAKAYAEAAQFAYNG